MKISRKSVPPTVPWAKWKHPYFWVASSFGLGLTPLRGPAGALLALPIAAYLHQHVLGLVEMLFLVLILYLIGVKAADWWNKQTNTKDSSPIVIDETVGMLLALSLLPSFEWAIWHVSVVFYATYWLIFILLDYFKLWPCKWLENRKGGAGVMLDDVAAGVQTVIVVYILVIGVGSLL